MDVTKLQRDIADAFSQIDSSTSTRSLDDLVSIIMMLLKVSIPLHQFKHDGLDTVHKHRGMMTIYDKLNEINAGWSVNSGSLVLQSTNSSLN